MAKESDSVPASHQVEADVLGAVLAADKDEKISYWRTITMMGNDEPVKLFHNSKHQILAQSIQSLRERDMPLTDSSIIDMMVSNGSEAIIDNASAFINSIMASSSISNINSLRESLTILVDKMKLRAIRDNLDDINKKISSDKYGPNEISNFVKDAATQNLTSTGIQTAGEMIHELLDDNGDSPWSVPTGIDKLDSYISGIEAGRVYVIAARPKIGKTTLATSITVNALEAGATIVSVSLELPKPEWSYRLLSTTCFMHQSLTKKLIYSHQPREEIFRNSEYCEDVEEDMDIFESALEDLKKAPIYPLFPHDVPNGFQSIVAAVIEAKSKNPDKPLILVIDYLQLAVDDAYNQVAAISQWTRALKLLAMEESIGIILLSQLNREGATGEMPTASQLRGSGSTEQDADVVILLNRKAAYNEENDWNEPEHIIDIRIALSRVGQTGTFQAMWDGACNNVSNLDED